MVSSRRCSPRPTWTRSRSSSDGGAALVREKLAALSAGERRALREALNELELV
jgi:hypothetical protein